MAKISNKEKGDNFADRVYANVEKIFSEGGLPFDAKICRPFREKGYYASARESNLKLDVTVEIWPPMATRWSLLWAFECKDEKEPISPGKLEKFILQLDQIAPANRKAVMVSTGPYTKGTVNVAKNKGAALVRLLPDDQVEYRMHYSSLSQGSKHPEIIVNKTLTALTDPDYIGTNNNFFGIYDGYGFFDWNGLLSSMGE